VKLVQYAKVVQLLIHLIISIGPHFFSANAL